METQLSEARSIISQQAESLRSKETVISELREQLQQAHSDHSGETSDATRDDLLHQIQVQYIGSYVQLLGT